MNMNASSVRSSKFAARLSGALAMCVGGIVLVGWALDIAALKSVLPGWVSMKPNTAVAFILVGIALLPPPPAQLEARNPLDCAPT
jgi:hypothetical protein